MRRKPPVVVGYEVAGVVDAVGAGAYAAFTPGDRVVALTRFGGYATHVVVPAISCFRSRTPERRAGAAALPVNYLTAFIALYRMANSRRRRDRPDSWRRRRRGHRRDAAGAAAAGDDHRHGVGGQA